MRRPTRTRRLSVAAIMSLLLFVLVAGAGVGSFWRSGKVTIAPQREIHLQHGNLEYLQTWPKPRIGARPSDIDWSMLGFKVMRFALWTIVICRVDLPLWFPLVLLLTVPARWLIARPADTPAFPVVTKQP